MEIRTYKRADEAQIKEIYQNAFAGFPWFEKLSAEEIQRRWLKHTSKRGFQCLVAVKKGQIIGASWWDTPTLDECQLERGDHLARFVFSKIKNFDRLIWIRETIISPNFQGKGTGTRLKKTFMELVLRRQENILILTRLRDDNLPILRIAESQGFKRTGIKVPSKHKKGTFHEYWYLHKGGKN